MASSFNPNDQINNIDFKLIYSLERISQVYKTLLLKTQVEIGLSPMQSQIILFIFFHDESRISISQFALEFSVKKSTISDAVNTLVEKKLIKKEKDSIDKRKQYIKLTSTGIEVAHKIESYAQVLEESVATLSNTEKSNFLNNLTKVLNNLNKKGLIPTIRMCQTCKYYVEEKKRPYCRLLENFLEKNELRVDCPEHTEKKLI